MTRITLVLETIRLESDMDRFYYTRIFLIVVKILIAWMHRETILSDRDNQQLQNLITTNCIKLYSKVINYKKLAKK